MKVLVSQRVKFAEIAWLSYETLTGAGSVLRDAAGAVARYDPRTTYRADVLHPSGAGAAIYAFSVQCLGGGQDARCLDAEGYALCAYADTRCVGVQHLQVGTHSKKY